MQARLGDSVSGRNRPDENLHLTKHVVAAGRFVKDAGSTPAASTNPLKLQHHRLHALIWIFTRRSKAQKTVNASG